MSIRKQAIQKSVRPYLLDTKSARVCSQPLEIINMESVLSIISIIGVTILEFRDLCNISISSKCSLRVFTCKRGFENSRTSKRVSTSLFLKRASYPNLLYFLILWKCIQVLSLLSRRTVDFNFSYIKLSYYFNR